MARIPLRLDDVQQEGCIRTTIMAREGDPKELKGAFLYLASSASTYTTGTDIVGHSMTSYEKKNGFTKTLSRLWMAATLPFSGERKAVKKGVAITWADILSKKVSGCMLPTEQAKAVLFR